PCPPRSPPPRSTLSLHDALPISSFAHPYASAAMPARLAMERGDWKAAALLKPIESKTPFTEALTYFSRAIGAARSGDAASAEKEDRKSTRLNSSHRTISYAVFCL